MATSRLPPEYLNRCLALLPAPASDGITAAEAHKLLGEGVRASVKRAFRDLLRDGRALREPFGRTFRYRRAEG